MFRVASLICLAAAAVAAKAQDEALYFNLRSEMWGLMRASLTAGLDLPEDNDLFTDLIGPEYSFTAKQRIQLEKKQDMKKRGLSGVRLFISDKCLGLVTSLVEFYLDALWQRCAVHVYRDVWTAVPTSRVREVAAMLKAIHAQEDRLAA